MAEPTPPPRRAMLLRVAPTAWVVEHAEFMPACGIVGWLPVYVSAEKARRDALGDDDLVIELDEEQNA